MQIPWFTASTLEARFRAAEPSARRAFVAALWAARGWETRVDGERVNATNHPEWADVTLLVPDGGRVPKTPPSDIDAVVTTVPPSRPRVVRTIVPGDLRRMALYAGDREAAADACRRFLGVSLGVDEEASSGVPLAEVGLVAVVGVVILAAVVGVVGETNTNSPPDAPSATPTPEAPVEEPQPLAPGMTRDGLVDMSSLVSAHADAVDRNRPYVWHLTYEEYNASERAAPTLEHNETVWVVDDHRYRVDKDILYGGRVPKVGPLVVSNRAYADGTYRYVRYRLGGHAEFERFPVEADRVGAQRFSSRSAELLSVLLDTNESWVRPVEINGEPYIQLYGSGTTRFTAERYRVVAFVTDEGFVRELSVTFRDPKTDTAVIFTYEYADFSGTLTPPGWAGQAGNVTVDEDGNVTDSSPTTPTPSDDRTTIPMPDATLPNGSETGTETATSGAN